MANYIPDGFEEKLKEAIGDTSRIVKWGIVGYKIYSGYMPLFTVDFARQHLEFYSRYKVPSFIFDYT
jgi:hypothetical protein